MKIVSLFLLAIVLGKAGCNAPQRELGEAIIEYTANTRGFYQKITIQNRTISVDNSRDGSEAPISAKIKETDWKQLLSSMKAVNFDQIATLKAPTEKRFYDGAAMAELVLTHKDTTYRSSTFDHGFPPAEIADLVNKINALATTDNDN